MMELLLSSVIRIFPMLLDTYNVVKQIKLSEKLVKLYTEKARLLGVKT